MDERAHKEKRRVPMTVSSGEFTVRMKKRENREVQEVWPKGQKENQHRAWSLEPKYFLNLVSQGSQWEQEKHGSEEKAIEIW